MTNSSEIRVAASKIWYRRTVLGSNHKSTADATALPGEAAEIP